ncbi:MAG: NAD(P)-binding domain-containing protein [Acidobacteriota bacterium]|nr:NAD(P)-binding domain-containing protein [Acidobacteriota bacterium]
MKSVQHEYLIIGAGPAGLQLGYFLHRQGRDYVILERGRTPGQFFHTFPRHRLLISINKVHTGYEDREINLRWDWNSLLSESDAMLFKQYSRDYFPKSAEMVAYLEDFADHFDLNIQYDAAVTRIEKHDGHFLVTDGRGRSYTSRRLIMATGASQPFMPSIPGIELTENYTGVSIDPRDFAGQRVLVIGKGNSAFETANHLLHTTALLHLASPNSLNLAWRSHFVGHLRSVNMTLLDSYLLKSQNVLIDATIKKIERKDGKFLVTYHYSHAGDEIETLTYDRVVACTGFRFDVSPFDEPCRPALVFEDRFPAMTSEWESTNVPDLYFAGVIMQSRDYKKKQSAFIHGFRYNIELLHRLLEQKYHDLPLAFRRLRPDPTTLMEAVIRRVNYASSLWQQTGYFCDALIVQGDEAAYYGDLTLDYVHDKFGACAQYYTVTLEFGQERIDCEPDSFAVKRVHKDDADRAELSTAIHPVIRRYAHGRLLNTHHVIEDLESVWAEEVHTEPLEAYFARELGQAVPAARLNKLDDKALQP